MNKVLIADDHHLVAESLAAHLEASNSFQVFTASTLSSALSLLSCEDGIDVALIDLVMPGMDGLASIEKIVKDFQNVPIVVFSGTMNAAIARNAFRSGARGFVTKDTPLKAIPSIISMVLCGGTYIPPTAMPNALSKSPEVLGSNYSLGELTGVELDVLRLVLEGGTNKEIAWTMKTTEIIVKMHMRNICRKLSAKNRTHAIVIARRLGII